MSEDDEYGGGVVKLQSAHLVRRDADRPVEADPWGVKDRPVAKPARRVKPTKRAKAAPPNPDSRTAAVDRSRRRWTVGLAAAGVAVAVGFGFLVAAPGVEDPAPASLAASAAPTTTAQPVGGPSVDSCPASSEAGLERGAGPGSQTSGAGVVFAFQHAYWVARDAGAVWAVTAPDAALPPPAEVQRGIDSIPLGSTHCLAVMQLSDGRFGVELAWRAPDGVLSVERQVVSVAQVGGRFVVAGVAAL